MAPESGGLAGSAAANRALAPLAAREGTQRAVHALREYDAGLRLAEVVGYSLFIALIRYYRGEGQQHGGELDEALTDQTAARAVLQRIGIPPWGPVNGLADVYWERGDFASARAPYEEAVFVGERAGRSLRAVGMRTRPSLAAGLLAHDASLEEPPVAIRTLGGFGVVRDGTPVALTEWQSKKARDLLKLLVARRGRPTARDKLMETLWPDEDPAKLSNRLSVALATVRGVLDPAHRSPPNHFVPAEKATISLDLNHVEVDVEQFVADAKAGLELSKARLDEATRLLESAEAAYTGDFLEEDLYEDWAATLREEARVTYIQVARSLAVTARGRGDHDATIRYALRILERDPYDEDAHLTVVATLGRAGRHGEARRRYRAYVAKMREIDVEPAPFPSVVRT